MKPIIKRAFVGGILIYSIGLTYHSLNVYSDSVETVVRVENDTISRGKVLDYIIDENWNTSVSEMTDELLIQKEAEKLKLLNPSNDELNKELQILKTTENNTVLDLNNPEDYEYIKNRIVVKKIAEKNTVNDEKLQAFVEETGGLSGAHIYKVSVFEGEHETVDKITKDIESGKKISEIEGEFEISFEEKELGDENEYGLDLHDVSIGDVQHAHGEQSHAVLILNEVTELTQNLTKDKDSIMKEYLAKKYFYERIQVINYLRTQYAIEVSQHTK